MVRIGNWNGLDARGKPEKSPPLINHTLETVSENIPSAVTIESAAKLLSKPDSAPNPYYTISVDTEPVFMSEIAKRSYVPIWLPVSKTIKMAPKSILEITIKDRESEGESIMETFQIDRGQLEKAAQNGQLVVQGKEGVSEITINVRVSIF